MHLPSRRRIKKNLSRKLIYSPFLRMILFSVWFRVAVLLFLVLGTFLALFIPKIWLATPEGFLPEIRISWLDRVQAWSLRRAAEQLTAAGKLDDAETRWRAAIANNQADVEMYRASLRSLLKFDPPERKYLPIAFGRASWAMRLSGTNAVDLALASEVLDRYEIYDYQIRLLAPWLNQLGPPQEVALLKALFQTGLIPQFLDRWNKLSTELRQDPTLVLHHAAYLAGWGPPETMAEGRTKLAEAQSDPARRVLASRLQLQVAGQMQDVAGFGATLELLEQYRADQLSDHVRYWLLLAGAGRREEAARLAEVYPHAPTNPNEVVRIAEAHVQLGQKDTARRFYQHYTPTFGYSADVWVAYARLLVDMKAWEELRAVALQLRQQKVLGDTMAAYSHYLEGRAELALERRANADQCFQLAASTRLDAPILRLEVGRFLARQQNPSLARAVLVPAEQSLAKSVDYWNTMLELAVELKEGDWLGKAASALYALQPNKAQSVNSYAAALLVNRERPEEAIKLTLQLVSAYPGKVATRINHSFALLMNNRVSEALALLQTLPDRAMAENDRNAYNLARFEVHMALGQPEEARRFGDRINLKQLFPVQVQRVERLRAQLPPQASAGP